MSESGSYRQILRSTSIIGGAAALNIGIGLVRMKAVALLLGPAGVGLIGLATNVVALAANVAGLGFGTVGTRQVAEAAAQDDPQAIATARRALFWGTLGLAILGGLALWALRGPVATHLLGDPSQARLVGWLAPAVALTVAAASQSALLTGLRRIGDLARVQVAGGVLATVLGLAALWAWGQAGIVGYVIAAPLAAFLFGHLFVSRLPRLQGNRSDLAALAGQWRTLARLGTAFMVAGLAGTVGQLLVRTLVQRELGAEALGQFQAAWMLSMTYIGFVLGAMGTDYYPRLTAVIADPAAVNRLVNQQTEVALLLATPVLLATLALAPWVVRLLYSAEFGEAAEVLRWQVLGDFLKVASWPLGFILLAAGAGRTFMLAEWLGMGSFVLFTWVGLPWLGVAATGLAFLGLYAVYLPMVYLLARRRTGFVWDRAVGCHLILACIAGVGLVGLGEWSAVAATLIGVPLAGLAGVYSLARLGRMVNPGGKVGQLVAWGNGIAVRMRWKQ